MAGNMTLPEVSVTYQVQITASLRDSDDTVRETKRSPVSQSGTLFVPLPGQIQHGMSSILYNYCKGCSFGK